MSRREYAKVFRDQIASQPKQAWYSLPILILFFTAAYSASWWVRFEGNLGASQLDHLLATLPFVVVLELAAFYWFKIHNLWNRYVTFHDLVHVAQATTCAAALNVLCDYCLSSGPYVPRSVHLINWCIVFVGVAAIRSVSRGLRERNSILESGIGEPVLILGDNDAGESLLRAIRQDSKNNYRVIGFVSSEKGAVGLRISGIPVMGTLDQTCSLAVQYGISEVFITAGTISGKRMRRLMSDCETRGVRVRVLPSYDDLLSKRVELTTRSVSIEDLLRRDPIDLDQSKLSRWLDSRTLLVTGSAGSIGSEICRQLLRFNPSRIVLVDRSESGQFFLDRELRQLSDKHEIIVLLADGNDEARMQQIFERYRPDVVFHAAAYKHVPLMEENCGEAVKNIVLLTKRLADLAAANGVKSFVMVSTDKAVNPTNVMGACKRVAELYVQSLNRSTDCEFVTVRFGNVLDSAGSVIPIFRKQIEMGGPVTVTHPDMVRYFMTIPEASQLVIQAGAMGNGGEIFVLDMGEPFRIVDLARDLIRLSGLRPDEDIDIEFIGMRPGEKLFEELCVAGEEHLPTHHPKITVVESNVGTALEVQRSIKRLGNMTTFPNSMIIDELMRIVPQFRPASRTTATTTPNSTPTRSEVSLFDVSAPGAATPDVSPTRRAA